MIQQIKSEMFFCTVLFVLAAASMCLADDFEDSKQKRGMNQGSVGLFPFPRVGRSDPDLEWDNSNLSPYGSLEDYEDLGRHEMKRQGLVAFPRVGRNPQQHEQQQRYWSKQLQNEFAKRTGASNANANSMWFGPRLGKVQKRSADYTL